MLLMRMVPILASALTLGLAAGYAWSAMPPAEAQVPASAPRPAQTPAEVEHSRYFANCAEARAAGAAPIYAGQPGYRSGLDSDSDGIACEPYRGGR